jgi:hypothetical protein
MNEAPQHPEYKFKTLLNMENYSVIELTSEEMISIDGGKTFSYYVGLVIGATAGTIVSLVKGFQDGVDGHHA